MNRRERALQRSEDRIFRLTVGGPPETKWQRLVSALTEPGYAVGAVRRRLGLSTPALNTADRRVLEETIFPYYCSDLEFKRVLFVGCAVFTAHYQKKFFADKEFWTIEPDGSQARFGSTHHVIGTLEEAPDHFDPSYFDLIFCNGVYGWGIDTLAQGEAAFRACHALLRAGGQLVFGWNDLPQRTPFALDKVKSRNSFARFDFPPLGGWRHVTATRHRHVFDVYQKPVKQFYTSVAAAG